MKEKMLKEKGGTKVYIIVIVVLVILCAALGAFAVINMNKDKEDDEKTSKKNETNTSKTTDNETKNDVKNKTNDDEDDDDEEDNSVQKYTGTIDMTELMGTDELKDTVWTLTIEGDDDTLSKMVIRAELEKYLRKTFDDAVGDSDAYTYEEFVDLIHTQLDSTMGSIGTEMASDLGVSASKISSNVDWVDDETLEIEIDLSKTKRSDYKGVDDDESVIEFMVEALKDQNIEMKKSK